MGWTHGQNERREITEKILNKEARRLQKTRKSEGRSEKGRVQEENWREKANNRNQITKVAVHRSDQ